MKYELYDYQEKMYKEVLKLVDSGERSIIVQLATRGGKSAIISKLTEKFQKLGVWFLAHTDILINQMSAEYQQHKIYHNFIKSGMPEIISKVVIVSKDTLVSRLDRFLQTGKNPGKLIIIDECHLAEAETFQKIVKAFSTSVVIGFTATPIRLDGKPLGNTFKKMVCGPKTKILQQKKKLSRIKNIVAHTLDDVNFHKNKDNEFVKKEVEDQVIKRYVIKDVVKHWEQHALWEKTLTFCVSIEHAKKLSKEFTDSGYPTCHVSSKDSPEIIKQKLDEYYSGKYINLCSVNLFLMGMTVKECSCIIQARPTNSYMIYKQTIGRGLMYIPGKVLINLDCCNNYGIHGAPSEDPEWDLFRDDSKHKTVIKRCPICDQSIETILKECNYCGYVFGSENTEPVQKKLHEIEGIMIDIESDPVLNNNYLIAIISKDAKTLSDARRIAKNTGFKMSQGEFIWKRILKQAC